MSTFGINVVGPVSANLGIGVALRHVVRLLNDRGCPLAILDRSAGLGRDGHDNTWAHLSVGSAEDLPHPVNLFAESILWCSGNFLKPDPGLLRPDRLNAGLLWWELPVLPQRSVEALRLFDALLCPTPYIEHAFAFNLSGPALIGMQHPVYLPRPRPRPDRARFGLPARGVVFLSSFEPSSGTGRKNPLGALHAFQRAFPDPGQPGPCLVFKLNNVEGVCDPAVQSGLEELEQARAADPRIRVVEEVLDYESVLSLYASCDVFVSLHRAEGLGLAPAEAMQLGRCVIATDWSGNRAYMDQASACLVRYKLTPAVGDKFYSEDYLGVQGYWAEPDLDDAALWMRQVYDDPNLRARKAEVGRAAAMKRQLAAEEGDFVQALEALWSRWALAPPSSPRYRDIAALEQAEVADAERRRPPEDPAAQPRRARPKGALRRAYERHLGWRFKR